jgi:hypothetical protein
MPNTLLTPSVIAREALATLYAQTVMLPLVHRDYSNEFAQVGDTVTVRKPAVFTANDFTSTITVQDAAESSVAVQMNRHLDVSFAVTSKELSLSISDFSTQLMAPAMEAIAQRVDRLLLGLYVDTYDVVGTAGTTPDGVDDITAVGRELDLFRVPLAERNLVVDAFAKDKFLQIPAFFEADKVGDDGSALRNASLGRKFGLNVVLGQNVAAHSNGTVAHTGTFAVNGAVLAGATTMNVDGSSTLTGTWAAGSVFTVAGVTGSFVVTNSPTAAANAMTGVSFFPAAPVGGFANDAVITRVANHTPNLAFHRTAFSFVSRPLALPMGVGAGQAAIVNYGGLGLRVVYGYDIATKKDTVSVDLLCGVKTLDAARAVRLLG